MPKAITARLGLAGFSTLLILGVTGCSSAVQESASQYIAVIDAGSSGTRLNLYQQAQDSVTAVELENSKMDVPLASLSADPAQAGAEAVDPLLQPLAEFAKEQNIAVEDITVNVLSTAGMRKVDAAAAEQIYESVDESITAAGFALGKTETITGAQEGLFAWADANSLKGTLGNSKKDPIGIVEVGGASAQVAFATTDATQVDEGDLVQVTINGVAYDVFTHSYLGLGQNDARSQMVEVTDADTKCYPNSEDAALTYEPNDAVSFAASTAEFNFDTCSLAYEGVIAERSAEVPPNSLASIAGFESTKFFGLSSIAYAASDFGVDAEDVQASLAPTVAGECTGTNAWATLAVQFPADQQDFAENACANGSYIATFLAELGIANDSLVADAKINGEAPSWTRGFVVLQSQADTQ